VTCEEVIEFIWGNFYATTNNDILTPPKKVVKMLMFFTYLVLYIGKLISGTRLLDF
jgi:hypothetical protein